MKKTYLCFLVTLLASVIASPAAAAIRYNVTDLGTLPGYESSHAWSINNNGQIVGEVFDFNNPDRFRAILFDTTGAGNNIDLGTLGGESSWAGSINNNGEIVGCADSNSLQTITHATIFDPNGTGKNIKLGDESFASSINNFGSIVGAEVNSSGYEIATLFGHYYANNNIELGTIDGFANSRAYSINDNGYVVGFAYKSLFPDSRAVLFDPSGQGNNIDLGTLGGEYSGAMSINNYGRIVGRADTASGFHHATLFDPNGQGNNHDLGTVAEYNFSVAAWINNCGQIVGQAWELQYNSPTNLRAVLFDPTRGDNNVDLNDLINPALGWTLQCAICINDNGWIIGWGTNPDGHSRSFLLTPTTPGDSEPDRDVDLRDFAIFAAAWRSTPADDNWNPFCDISEPNDDLIDERDLAVFSSNWLAQQ